jgi:hypothetical protein
MPELTKFFPPYYIGIETEKLAAGETRTPKPLGIRTSSVRVCQFHHRGISTSLDAGAPFI